MHGENVEGRDIHRFEHGHWSGHEKKIKTTVREPFLNCILETAERRDFFNIGNKESLEQMLLSEQMFINARMPSAKKIRSYHEDEQRWWKVLLLPFGLLLLLLSLVGSALLAAAPFATIAALLYGFYTGGSIISNDPQGFAEAMTTESPIIASNPWILWMFLFVAFVFVVVTILKKTRLASS